MTVKELIEELEKIQNKDLDVCLIDEEWGPIDINIVEEDGGYYYGDNCCIIKN